MPPLFKIGFVNHNALPAAGLKSTAKRCTGLTALERTDSMDGFHLIE
jgi:hypothetical protein